MWFEKRICVPQDEDLRKLILQEAHDSPYSVHPGNTKMYMDVKERFWWNGLKRDITEYIAKCVMCSHVKAEHQKPAELLQLYQYQSGSGNKLEWISSQDYPKLNQVMIRFGS